MNNDKTAESSLIEEMSIRCGKPAAGKVVLSIQDTTEVNLSRHSNRLKPDSGLGLIDASIKGYGFKIHPSLIIDAAALFPMGWADIHIWNRPGDKLNDVTRQEMRRTPIEKKESYKWIKASQRSKKALEEAAAIIIVQDREADIYDQFINVPDDKTFLLIRSRCDRNLTDGGKLWGRVNEQFYCGTYKVNIDGDSRSNQPKREAVIEVRYVEAEIKKAQGTGRDKKSVVVSIVEAGRLQQVLKIPLNGN